MRIHTDNINTRMAIVAAAIDLKERGVWPEHVGFKRLTEHASKTHVGAWEIQLEAGERDNGRRAGNSGSYGAMMPEVDGYAATYDEWGWLLSALFALDPEMVVGSPSHPVYANRVNFDNKTALTYRPDILYPLLDAGYWESFVGRDDYDGGDPFPYVYGRQVASRRGAGRLSLDDAGEWLRRGWKCTLSPRTPLAYAQWAHVVPMVGSAK